jgi:hypothetical protein
LEAIVIARIAEIDELGLEHVLAAEYDRIVLRELGTNQRSAKCDHQRYVADLHGKWAIGEIEFELGEIAPERRVFERLGDGVRPLVVE